MKNLNIEQLDKEAMEACRLRIDNLTKPLYSLSHLENIVERLAGILKNKKPHHLKMALAIFAADHAVNGPQNKTKGVESYDVLKNINDGFSATQSIAKDLEADVFTVDVGLEKDTLDLENIRQEKVCKGSFFPQISSAMTEEAVGAALEIGLGLASELKARGYQVVGLGNVGERAGFTALLITLAVTNYAIEDLIENNVCGLSLDNKKTALNEIISKYDLKNISVYEVLEHVGSPDIAAMVGFILGAATNRLAVVFDNEVTTAAVLLAAKINSSILDYVFTSAVYDNIIHRCQLEFLKMKAFLHYGFTIEEGLGSAMGLSIIKAGLHMLNDMKTFGEASVHVAEDGPGNERQDVSVRD